MIYRRIDRIGVKISLISMGGHEYLPDGRSRGFNEDFQRATRPGYLFEGFGQAQRQAALRVAYEQGINFFDVTQDTEKEALGRNLQEMPPPFEILVQTRPEGMVYTYDPYNQSMTDYAKLKREVQRALGLLRRERIGFYNFGIMRAALDHDPVFLAKLGRNIARLKREGLIRFACADTFSGEYTFLRQIESDAFDAININLDFADHGGTRRVLPAAQNNGLGVFCREAFMKAELFKMGTEVGITDRAALARLGVKWNLSHGEVTSLTVGTNNAEHLRRNLAVLEDLVLNAEDRAVMERVKTSPLFRAYEARKTREFFEAGA